MDIQYLNKALMHYNPKLYEAHEKCRSFTSIKFFNNTLTVLDPCILYICKSSSLVNQLYRTKGLNLLCVIDEPMDLEMFEDGDMNIIAIDESLDLTELFNEVYDILFIMHHHTDDNNYVFDQFINQNNFGDVNHISKIAYDILKNPLFFFTQSGGFLCGESLTTIPDIDEKSLKNYLMLNAYTINQMQVVEAIETKLKSELLNSNYNIIIEKIIVNQNIEAYFVLIERNQTFSIEDREVVQEFCRVLSLEKGKKPSSQLSQNKSLFNKLVVNLLEGNITKPVTIEKWLDHVSYRKKGFLHVLSIDVSQLKNLSTFINEVDGLHNTNVFYFNGHVTLLLTTKRKELMDQKLMASIENLLNKYDLEGGLSRSFEDIFDIRRFYLQSLKAKELGHVSNKQELIYIYDNYVIYHMLDMLPRGVDLKEFCHPGLLELLEYDNENNTQYTQTLYTLLLSKGKQVDAANELHIHRSTMVYRMEKIEELTGLNPYELKDIVRLYFSFIILKTLGLLDSTVFKGIF